MAAFDQHDDRGGQTGEMEEPALWTLFGPFGGVKLRAGPTAAAELVGSVPVDNLYSPPGHPE